MNIKDYSKYFKEIKSNICNIYNEFYVMDSLQNDKYEEIFNQNKYFWGIIIRSLGQSIMIELAKLFKESDGVQKEVSVYSLIRFIKNDNTRAKIKNKINQHQNIIDKLWKQRCRIFVHTDEKVFLSPEKFFSKYSIRYYEIEKLLSLAEEIIGDIDSVIKRKGIHYTFSEFKDRSQEDVRDIIDKLTK